MAFTEVTSTGWGSRIKNSFGGILFGILLFFGSFAVLFWNEGNSIKNIRAYNEMNKNAISVSSDKVDSVNEGKLVHTSGTAITEDILMDELFKVSENALMISRNVEMYQWKESKKSETKKKLGGGTETETTYTYSKDWSSSQIDSAEFEKPEGHDNPAMTIESDRLNASNASLGDFKLTQDQIKSIGGSEDLPYTQEHIDKLDLEYKSIAKLDGDSLYLGNEPSNPQLGDYRINYRIIGPKQDISIVAIQQGTNFVPYIAKNGKTKILIQMGIKSKDQMIESAKKGNQVMTWLLRFIGFIMMTIGLNLVFKPISVLGDVLPFIGSIIGAGFGVISFLISIVLSSVTIAIAWIFYRPIIAVIMFVIAVGAIAGIVILKKKKG